MSELMVRTFDPDQLLAALPRIEIGRLSASVAPRSRSKSLSVQTSYNGFTPQERSRTAAIAKWLVRAGAMPACVSCDICGGAARETHAEDYYDLATWLPICVGCHRGLHARFKSPQRWAERLDRHLVAADHWSRFVSPEPFDLAALLRQHGAAEPTYEDFI